MHYAALHAQVGRVVADPPKGLDAQEELSRMLSEEIAKAIDNMVLKGLLQTRFEENVALLERMFPGQNPHDALRGIGLGDVDLKREQSLLQRIRSARIDSIIFCGTR